jgi:hypothetical protein
MSLSWHLARLRAMSKREIGFRVGRALRARTERLGFGRAQAPEPSGPGGRSWVAELPRGIDPAPYVRAADRVLAGFYNVFALHDVQAGFPPRWNVDPKTRTEAPLVFGKTLDYRDRRVVGDIKHLWEINRHLELVTLAQAWHLTHEPKYAQGCQALLDSWFAQCPYPLGVNWCSSLEHGFRLTNWAFAWFLLGAETSPLFEGEAGAAFRSRWLRSVFEHCHFIAGHFSRHSSANNHLLGEATGLFIGATVWPMWEESGRWHARAHAELAREALEQNFADGVNKEQAVWYHQAVAEMLLVAGLVARANDCDFEPAYWRRLETMFEFIASIMDCNGHVPAFGDADDAVLLRLDPSSHVDVFRSALASGAVLFGRAELKAKAARLDDKTRWLLGDDAQAKFDALEASNAALPIRREFPDGGYFVLGGAFETPREIRVVADAGPLGYLSIAAHGHADALSFTLSAGGTEILADPGTFAYQAAREWREYFRGTSAHNTVRIDGVDQSVPGGSFLWLEHARARMERFETSSGQDRLVAAHDGYRRLSDPVTHRRVFCFDRDARTLVLIDELLCKGAHRAEWFWHFMPGVGVRVQGNELIAEKNDVRVTLGFPPELVCRLEAGAERPPLGWFSPSADVKVPAVTAVMDGGVRGNSSFQFELRITFV